MVDNSIPTNQFHPYQPPDAVPHSEHRRSGLNGLQHGLDRARGYARQNPGKFLGGLAALAIGLGVLRGRSIR